MYGQIQSPSNVFGLGHWRGERDWSYLVEGRVQIVDGRGGVGKGGSRGINKAGVAKGGWEQG